MNVPIVNSSSVPVLRHYSAAAAAACRCLNIGNMHAEDCPVHDAVLTHAGAV